MAQGILLVCTQHVYFPHRGTASITTVFAESD